MDVRIKYNKGKVGPISIDDTDDTKNTLSTEKERNEERNSDPNALVYVPNLKKNALRWKKISAKQKATKTQFSEFSNIDNFRRAPSYLGLELGLNVREKNVSNPSIELMKYFSKLSHSSDENETINVEYVESLLKSGASINYTDLNGQNVLHEVAVLGNTDIAVYLLKKGADCNQGDKYGRTPLHVAASVDNSKMVELLLDKKANIEAKTIKELQTPIFYAAKNDAVDSLKILVKRDCHFKKIQDYRGRTPIYVAAELDRSETTKLLLELKAPGFLCSNDGSRAINWMINKMPPVAYEALNQLHLTDRPNRKQYYSLNYLFHDKEKNVEESAQTSLHFIVGLKQYDLIMNPVIKRLLNVMWDKFGRKWAWINLCQNFIYILLWTVIGLVVEYDKRHHYNLPQEIWRIILYILAALMTFYQIYEEVMEFKRSQNHHNAWEEKRKKDIQEDKQFCHPRWPEEQTYLENEIKELEKLRPKYFKDAWNIFDWLCYIGLLICMATHVADIISHSETLARVHIRLLAATIILLWLRLMKHARAFELLGPFIVMLGHMLKDFARFLFLYLEFYIPYLTAFWMIFGGTKMAADNSTEEVTVGGFTYPGEIIFSTFRLTLVDDYDYDGMQKVDSIMADLLLGTYFILSAILCLNLFIALLSDTFQRVYENAHANAVMQRAIFLISIWESMSAMKKGTFLQYINDECSPLKDDYDDDMTQAGEDDLKKITFQIKENLDNLQEMFKLQFGDPKSHLSEDKGGAVDKKMHSSYQLSSDICALQKSLSSFQQEQTSITIKIQKDLTSVKNMLRQVVNKKNSDLLGSDEESNSLEIIEPSREKAKEKKLKRRQTKKYSKTVTLEIDDNGISQGSEFSPSSFPNFTNTQSHKDDTTNC